MGAGEKKNTCSVQYRRPFGCAVVSIADLLTADSKDDHLLKVYASIRRSNIVCSCDALEVISYGCNTEIEWYQIHENIIKKANSRYNLSGSNTAEKRQFGWAENSEVSQYSRLENWQTGTLPRNLKVLLVLPMKQIKAFGSRSVTLTEETGSVHSPIHFHLQLGITHTP
ncbi:hypothetical protein CCH79_00015227 [Gambusia affinis]|uniref:Dedicator of cytokinesis N-terminal domain-containing protein n=1 Tax=Gambusia affinis TaxID=33528 RepID=A0A315VS62_GAMAF|nr:hypothetical protein CCH79_00015227 [Gambusia affinis]